MIANVHSEINLKQGLPTLETFKDNFEDFTVNIHLEPEELVIFFKNYIKEYLDIDLDMLNVLVIFDSKTQRFVLDTEELETNDKNELLYMIDEFKHHFGKSIFIFRAIINSQVLFRRLFNNYDSYNWNQDGSIDIEYSLYNITKAEFEKFIDVENE